MRWNGVAATALAVTIERALETRRPDRLIEDPYAEAFVRAADAEVPDSGSNDYLGVRSAYFDAWLQGSWDADVRQTVILGAGLDMRAFRLDRPSDATVFEIDQPAVFRFKTAVLREMGLDGLGRRHCVELDLAKEWADSLVAAGFDPALPTAWLAEGLLLYLAPDVEQRLLTTITELSPTGSRLAVEGITGPLSMVAGGQIPHNSRKWDIDTKSLFNTEDRPDPAQWLAENGWSVHQDRATRVAESFGRELLRTPAEGRMITAVRDGDSTHTRSVATTRGTFDVR